jgi:hypothetical protein
MRVRSLALVVALAAVAALTGCATASGTLDLPPSGPYRVPGRAPDPMPFSAEEGALAYSVDPSGSVGYGLDAAVTKGEVRVTVLLLNRGRQPLTYDLRRLTLTARGKRLKLVSLEEDPGRRVSAEERARDDYRKGVRTVPRGERDVITRRYGLAAEDADEAASLLRKVELEDEVASGDEAAPVRLTLERAR